jgi:hypothetical protein
MLSLSGDPIPPEIRISAPHSEQMIRVT